MCTMKGWDEVYGLGADQATVEPHSCRVLGDCGGGEDFDKACDAIARFYEQIAKEWRDRTHYDLSYHGMQVNQEDVDAKD